MSVLRQQAPARSAAEFAVIIYLPAAKKSFLNHTRKSLALIGRQFMTMMQQLSFDFELLFRIPDYQIGIVAGCDLALTILQTNELRRSGAQPAAQVTD